MRERSAEGRAPRRGRRAKELQSPAGRPVTERWKEQRERLLQAAQRAIHRAGARVSMDEIAAEAGITKPIFYRHFGDRRGLACALRDSTFGLSLADPRSDPADVLTAARQRIALLYPVVSDVDQLRRLIVSWASGFRMFVEMNPNLYRFLLSEGVLDSMWGEQSEPIAETLASSLRAVYADRALDERTALIWAHAVRGMVRETVDWSVGTRGCDRFELESQLELAARALIEGLGRALPRTAGRASTRPARGGRKTTTRRQRRS